MSTTQAEPKKATLSTATRLLMRVAARSHSLCDYMGIEFDHETETITFLSVHRPWLKPHFKDSNELQFDADTFAKDRNNCSDGESDMRLWLLNVWNPSYAKSKGWHFDFMRAMQRLDAGNREAIAWWITHNVWP